MDESRKEKDTHMLNTQRLYSFYSSRCNALLGAREVRVYLNLAEAAEAPHYLPAAASQYCRTLITGLISLSRT